MARALNCSILEAIAEYTEDTEVPPIFSIWIGVSAVGSALGRNCFLDQGFFVIYPNTYIILVAGSAQCKKSTAINIAEDLLKEVKPKVNMLSQKMTPEALISALSGLSGEEGGTQVIPMAVGSAIVDELSTLIDKNSFKSGMIALLTDLYDARDFEYMTKSRGKELVKNPCLTLLGGSTLHWIKEAIPEVAVGGGFTSRILFIYKESNNKLVPWPVMTEENKKRRAAIIHDLCEVANMRGGFALDNNAMNLYKSEYVNFRTNSNLQENSALSGYSGRRNNTLLKLAMIISASRRSDKLITAEDLGIAIQMIRNAEEFMPHVLRAITSKDIGSVFEDIVRFIMYRKIVSRADLIKQFRSKMTAVELDVMMNTLEEEGVVIKEVEGSKVKYIFNKNKAT
jgi:hypothetical protein